MFGSAMVNNNIDQDVTYPGNQPVAGVHQQVA